VTILAIETTGQVSSVALISDDNGRVMADYSINSGLTHSQTLMPMIDQMLISTNFTLADIGVIAVSSGPGSFTGLRIGAAAAKGLAFALDLKIVPVSTLDALAYNAIMWEGMVVPIMDARRGQVYSAIYDCHGGKINRISEYMLCDFDEIYEMACRGGSQPPIFLGDAVCIHIDKIKNKAPSALLLQKASSVGTIALESLDSAINANLFEPFYIRPSQAEREYKG